MKSSTIKRLPPERRKVVIHSTGTRPNVKAKELKKLPFHFLITRSGKLLRLRKPHRDSRTIKLALAGGINRHGEPVDNRTERQSDTLFNALVVLSETCDTGHIKSSKAVRQSGFDVQGWLREYIPAFLQAA